MTQPEVTATLIDLRARTRQATIYRAVGGVLAYLVGLGCVAAFLFGPDDTAVRIAAGSAVLVVVVGLLVVWRTRHRQVRWLGVDHEGIRLLNHRGRALSRFAWGDLAGVGLMTNEAARRRKQFAARLDAFPMTSMIWVPIWLELHPAGPDAVRRHPELRAAWELGRRQRWVIAIGGGPGQSFPVGEHVRRWRPELWRGHREGSVLFG